MASETTTANPELLQTQVAQLLVQPLEAASVVLASGVRIFDTSAPLRIPKLVSGASAGFVAESGLIPRHPARLAGHLGDALILTEDNLLIEDL